MRELIDLFKTPITEGVGLSNRKPGDKWANEKGEELTFQSLEYYPERGGYETVEDRDAAIVNVCKELGIGEENILWANSPQSTSLGFGIAHFIDSDSKDFYLGRYFKQINPNRASNSFPNNLPGGFRFQSAVAKKESAGMKPTDFLKELKSQTPASIQRQVLAHFGEESAEYTALETFMAADSFPIEFPKGDMNPEAFNNYFAEVLQPMALVMGKPVDGNAEEAEKIFFGDAGYGTAVISFNDGVTDGLFDSLLINSQGKQIKISSKGKGGANASIINLIKSVNELKNAPEGKRLLSEYKEEISYMQIIKDGGHTDGCLNLAVLMGMITTQEKEQVKKLKNVSVQDDFMDTLSDNLQKLYKARGARDPGAIIPIEHMLAAIAYPLADKVNEESRFSEAASAILNHSALVQVYTTSKVVGDNIVLEGFNAVYPSETVTGVLMSATKSYMSTQGKGNMTFKILKNGATDEETKIQDLAVDTKPDVQPADIELTNYPNSPQKRGKPKGTPGDLGRSRRK